jgi:hypothetical protein
MSKQFISVSGGRTSGKSKAMQKAIDQVFEQNPLAKILIVSTKGNEVIEGTTYEEVNPAALPSPKNETDENV